MNNVNMNGVNTMNNMNSVKNHGNGPSPNFTTTMRMSGLPYVVTIEEIETFFRGFSYISNSINLERDNDGRLSGVGFIEFETSLEA